MAPNRRDDAGHASRSVHPRQVHQRVNHARQKAKDYFAQYPKDLFEAEVESWRDLGCSNIEFTMKRLREPKPS
jgi:hypothetical protein